MKIYQFHLSTMPLLFACSLLLTASTTALAAKPTISPKAKPIVTDSVVVDFINSKIIITGKELLAVNEASLGGTDISADINATESTNTSLVLDFSADMEGAVSAAGSYALVLNGNAFSVYMISAITNPDTAACPCVGLWSSYGSKSPPDGFSTLEPFCTFESSSGDQVGVEFYNAGTNQLWILTSEYNTTAKECALVIDEPAQTLSSPQQHTACSDYLKASYFATSGSDCGSLPSFP